jgi:bis(5'-adenosyl)-triphosphatase
MTRITNDVDVNDEEVIDQRRNRLLSSTLITNVHGCDNNSHTNTAKINTGTQFGKFFIREECIFYRTLLSVAFINLRPIVPGHVLVIPCNSIKQQLYQLSSEEYDDLWRTVRIVQSILQHQYGSSDSNHEPLSFNVAVQDGKDAGQSVAHVHVHILPRHTNDITNNDDIYDALEMWEPKSCNDNNNNSMDNESMKGSTYTNSKRNTKLHVPTDVERKDRTMNEMINEAEMYRKIIQQYKLGQQT